MFCKPNGKLRKNKNDQRMRMWMGIRMLLDGRTMARACRALEACTGIFIYLYIVFYNPQQEEQQSNTARMPHGSTHFHSFTWRRVFSIFVEK